jgi:predicted MPP superfamily phosphohydrolase
MYKLILITLLLIVSNVYGLTIYDLQYTTDPGSDGTYPSPYEGQTVTVTGIVTADNYSNSRFFLSMPEGGAWKGIYVYNNSNLNVGDEVSITGEVTEYWGFTEITDISNLSLLSTGNTVQPTIITTGQLNSNEAYEGVLVRVQQAQIIESYDQYGNLKINDGTGTGRVGTGAISLMNTGFDAIVGSVIASLTGVISYSYGDYYLNPRSTDDLILGDMPITISTDDIFVNQDEEFYVPLQIFHQDDLQINSFHIELSYNNNMLEFTGLNYTSAVFSNSQYSSTSNTIEIDYTGNATSTSGSTLLNLSFNPIGMGNTTFYAFECSLNGEEIDSFSFGNLNISISSSEEGDILTTVQRPILSVPQISHPGESFEIWASAPVTTSGWQASLQYEDYSLELDIVSSYYDSVSDWHILTVETPQPAFYELFDLIVTAPGLEVDHVKNAVKIEEIPEDDWYFIHITDTHLPTHLFSHDSNYYNDMTEMEDFLTVIEDINLLNPKFVLFTGDIVNEGELEEYLDARYYSIAKNMLGLLEAPVYLVSGNHDIGGWQDTPMPDGSSRTNWHNFFGWDILENPNGSYPYRTQNYSFTYDGIRFIGLESYINYDDYLPSVFGDESFTYNQMTWLNSELASAEATKVLFYHYDFSDQINLYSQNAQMALSGHIHYDEGSISQAPYDLATGAVCDGNRKYRIIKVSNGVLQPQASVTAGSSGENFQVNYDFPNNGSASSNRAEVVNFHNIAFSDLLLKFEMQDIDGSLEVENGLIKQVVTLDNKKIVYVQTQVQANSVTEVNLAINTSNANDAIAKTNVMDNVVIYPNPHKSSLHRGASSISFDLNSPAQVSLSIYNLKGQKVVQLANHLSLKAGNHNFKWDSISQHASGVYLIKLDADNESQVLKFISIK